MSVFQYEICSITAGYGNIISSSGYDGTKGQVVAIDGKTVRRNHGKTSEKDAIHLLSACIMAMCALIQTTMKHNVVTLTTASTWAAVELNIEVDGTAHHGTR